MQGGPHVTLNPAIRVMLDKARAVGTPALSAGTPADARALMETTRLALGDGSAVGSSTRITIPTRHGTVAATLLLPAGHPAGLVVYLHGGGWVVGSAADFDVLARTLVLQSGCAMILPDYRLAPEHPFPAALDDTEDVLRWAWAERTGILGFAGPLVVAGDSAGGNLAAVATQTLREQIVLAGQVLIYPVTDTATTTASYAAYGEGLVLTRADMAWFLDHYAPAADRADPRLAPLRAPDLTGLPPTTIISAECDVLRDEGRAYAERLRAAGVATQLREYAGMTHGFIRLHRAVDTAAQAVADIAADLRAFCGHRPTERTVTP